MHADWTLISIFTATIVVGVLVHWFTFRRRLQARFREEVERRLNEELKRRVYERLAVKIQQEAGKAGK